MISWTDATLEPWLLLLADWSLRWAVLIGLLAIGLAVRPPRRTELRYLVCWSVLLAGLAWPALPAWGPGFWPTCVPSSAARNLDTASPAMPVTPISTERMEPLPQRQTSDSATDSRPATTPSRSMSTPVPTATASMPSDTAARFAWPRFSGKQLLTLGLGAAWAVGVLIGLLRISGGLWWTLRLRKTATPLEGDALTTFQACSRAMQLRRPVRLVAHAAVGSPVTLGFWRPVVVVPSDWASLPLEAQRSSLWHELRHVAGYHTFQALAEELIRAMFFFHPLVHWLVGRIRLERELLCDDAAVADRADPTAHARTLLDFARRAERLAPAHVVSLSFGNPSTVKTRIERLLDPEAVRWRSPLPRGRKLLAVILLLGLVGGLGSLKLRAEAPTPSAKNPAEEKPATQTTTKESPEATKTLRGQVVDEQGQPVAGAQLWWRVKRDWEAFLTRDATPFVVTAQSDTQGRFRLDVPTSWFATEYPTQADASLWAYAPGYQIATERRIPEAIIHGKPVEEVKLVLAAAADTTLVVHDPQGQPLAGATVGPGHIDHDIPPHELLSILTAQTDAQGRATLPVATADRMHSIKIITESWGEQHHYLSADGPKPYTVHLRPVGRLEGRLTAENPAWVRGLKGLAATGDDFRNGTTCGRALFVTDEQGRFVISTIATGPLKFHFAIDPRLPVRPRYPQEESVEAGATKQLEIPLVRGVAVSGILRVRDSHTPVTGAELHLIYGINRGIYRQFDRVVSDAEGKFSTIVLPGQLDTQIIYLPEQFTRPETLNTVTVPDDREAFSLPPIEVIPARLLAGRLVDEADRPVRDASVTITIPSRNRCYFAKDLSKDDGQFEIRDAPEGSDPKEFQCSVRFGNTEEGQQATVIQSEPLVLRLAPLWSIEGSVVDPEGKPLVDAEVKSRANYDANPHLQERTARTDATGRFRLTGFPAGRSLNVRVVHKERNLAGQLTVEIPKEASGPQVTTVTIAAKSAGRIVGQVLVDGKPQSGLQVPLHEWIYREERAVSGISIASTTTDAAGQYVFDLIEPETHVYVQYFNEDGTYTSDRTPELVLKPGETRKLEPLQVYSRRESIAGTVVDPDGNPVAGIKISVEMRDRTTQWIGPPFSEELTGKDGRFKIGLLPNLPLTVMAYVPPEDPNDLRIRFSASVEANPGDQEIQIVLDPKLVRKKK